jgi:DnaJ-class molecular chaperone
VAALKALSTLDLDDSADAETIKARYKELVKRLHPDANGGDRSREDKLREIIQAYNYLRSAKLV